MRNPPHADASAVSPGTTGAPVGDEVRATGLVSAIRRLAVHDGPGIRTIVFLKGCPLRCAWCAAPETQEQRPELLFYPERCLACDRCRDLCPEGAVLVSADGGRRIDRGRCTACGVCVEGCYAEALKIRGETMTVAQVLAEVLRDRVFYQYSGGGITVSGGEPLLQVDFTVALLRALKGAGLHTAMETSGFQHWEVFARALQGLDLLLYDLKQMDPQKHRRYTGVPNDILLGNLRRAVAQGVLTIIRVPVIPGFNDEDENFWRMGEFLQELGAVRQIDLLPYHRLGETTYGRLGRDYGLRIPPVPEETLEHLAGILRAGGVTVQIAG